VKKRASFKKSKYKGRTFSRRNLRESFSGKGGDIRPISKRLPYSGGENCPSKFYRTDVIGREQEEKVRLQKEGAGLQKNSALKGGRNQSFLFTRAERRGKEKEIL